MGFFAQSDLLRKPGRLIPACGACKLHTKCKWPKLQPIGEGWKSILIVLDAPTKNDDEAGRLLSGDSGKLVKETLRSVGVDPEKDAVFTSAAICHTSDMSREIVDFCRPNLNDTIKKMAPRVVIPMGRHALASVIAHQWADVGMIDRWTGCQIPFKDYWVCPTFSPEDVLRARTPLLERNFSNDIEAAIQIRKDPQPLTDLNRHVRLIFNEDLAEAAILDVIDRGLPTAIDYETNCLKPEFSKSRIFSCAIGNGEDTFAFPWPSKSSKLWLAIKQFILSDVPKIASNLKFEERWTLRTFGHGMNNWHWDTMLATHCLDNRPGICSLKFQAFVQLGVPVYNAAVEPYLDSKEGRYNRIAEIDTKTLLIYNGIDSFLEERLAKMQRERMGYKDTV